VSVLVDTNVLVLRTQRRHETYATAVRSIAHLLAQDELVFFTLQNIAEFWNVATRPVASNGLGLSTAEVLVEVGKIEELLTYLPDASALYEEWKRLVVQHSVQGAKVHDARLVAAMNVHGIRRLLTFDAGDFARYNIEVIHPASLLS
jgi:predicted nucleic acid-binding protein